MFDKEDIDLEMKKDYYGKAVNEYRLKKNPLEILALQFLYEHSLGGEPLRRFLIQNLCEGRFGEFRDRSPPVDYDVLHSFLDTIFQWFGTAVGESTLRDFLGAVDYLKDLETEMETKDLPKYINDKNKTKARLSKFLLSQNSPVTGRKNK